MLFIFWSIVTGNFLYSFQASGELNAVNHWQKLSIIITIEIR